MLHRLTDVRTPYKTRKTAPRVPQRVQSEDLPNTLTLLDQETAYFYALAAMPTIDASLENHGVGRANYWAWVDGKIVRLEHLGQFLAAAANGTLVTVEEVSP